MSSAKVIMYVETTMVDKVVDNSRPPDGAFRVVAYEVEKAGRQYVPGPKAKLQNWFDNHWRLSDTGHPHTSATSTMALVLVHKIEA